MAEVISINELKPMMQTIWDILHQVSCDRIIWFGNARCIPFVNDYLRADGRKIDVVVDNNPNLWGTEIISTRNIELQKQLGKADDLVLEKLFVQSPDILRQEGDNTIFFIASQHGKAMKEQIMSYGIAEKQIFLLPTEKESHEIAMKPIQDKVSNLERLDLHTVQQIELEILKVFKRFCDSNNLTYFLGGGTLIGAIRHQGFIPWDDDIDVFMPYEDYIKFVDIFPTGGQYEVVNWKDNDDYIFQFAKLVDNNTFLIHEGYPVKCLMGIYIDVFPLAGYPDNPKEIEKKWVENAILNQEWYWYYNAKDIVNSTILDYREEVIKQKYKKTFNESNVIGPMETFVQRPWAVEKRYFREAIEWIFEDEYFKIPIGYDEWLTTRYGDYMKLPKESQRVAHLFPAYNREN